MQYNKWTKAKVCQVNLHGEGGSVTLNVHRPGNTLGSFSLTDTAKPFFLDVYVRRETDVRKQN